MASIMESLRKLAKEMGAPNGYITDSATNSTHPSDKGHMVMGRKAIADFKAQYSKMG